MHHIRRSRIQIAIWLLLSVAGSQAMAQSEPARIAAIEARMAAMAEELASLRAELSQVKSDDAGASTAQMSAKLKATEQAVARAEKSANEWKSASSVAHLSGYASADYVSPENGNSTFVSNFNPMFHFLSSDKVLWEAELEIEIEPDGATSIGLEYSTVDLFLNDNMVLVAGKFLSPIGDFRQNLHPSWINKLPSAPPGFGHDGAAPISEVGLQLRGVVPTAGQSRITYAAYVGNGPQLEGEDGEIHAVEAEGFSSDPDGEKVYGGRVSFMPAPSFEIAISGAFGDVAIVRNDEEAYEGDPTRGYSVLGFDANYRWNNFDFRGEYVKQEVDPQDLSVAPEGGEWSTWYTQAAYKFGPARKWEGVVRYADFKSPHADDTKEQWALGMSYLITPSAFAKFGYEFNSGEAGESTNDDRWIAQLVYGY